MRKEMIVYAILAVGSAFSAFAQQEHKTANPAYPNEQIKASDEANSSIAQTRVTADDNSHKVAQSEADRSNSIVSQMSKEPIQPNKQFGSMWTAQDGKKAESSKRGDFVKEGNVSVRAVGNADAWKSYQNESSTMTNRRAMFDSNTQLQTPSFDSWGRSGKSFGVDFEVKF